MPTTRPRHVVTETEHIARALDDAARRWPEVADNRAKLVVRLLLEGHQAIRRQGEDSLSARRHAVEHTRGALTGTYDRDYLAELREEWPA